MKLAGTYVGRLRLTVWRRKSTLLGAAMALALVVVCLQYNAAKEVVEVPPPPAAEETAEARANSVQFVANLPATGASLRTDSQGDLVDSAADANYVSGNLIYSGLDPKFNYVPPQRLVHLDLKGAPPKVPYLKRLLTLSREMGATGVLLEWEDMFPWSGELSPLAATNAYTRRDVDEIVETARSVHLEIIPLVQTFGHVEFALKHKEFTALREVPDSPQAICPSLNASVDLVYQMIDQQPDLHSSSVRGVGNPASYKHMCESSVFSLLKLRLNDAHSSNNSPVVHSLNSHNLVSEELATLRTTRHSSNNSPVVHSLNSHNLVSEDLATLRTARHSSNNSPVVHSLNSHNLVSEELATLRTTRHSSNNSPVVHSINSHNLVSEELATLRTTRHSSNNSPVVHSLNSHNLVSEELATLRATQVCIHKYHLMYPFLIVVAAFLEKPVFEYRRN
ncbi:hypothetical protein J6590_043201 [Homalodisca vitripennis]|nr:hypothetical protein J6590_043201 [Homalodisca vitripennis]